MEHKSPHIEELREEIRSAGEDAKRMIDHVIRAACLLFADRGRAGELGDVNTSVETRLAPIWNDKQGLTVKALAKRWGVSPRSIYQWTLTHGLPYRKMGRVLRFDWIEVDRWSNQHREAFTKARLRGVRYGRSDAAATKQRSK